MVVVGGTPGCWRGRLGCRRGRGVGGGLGVGAALPPPRPRPLLPVPVPGVRSVPRSLPRAARHGGARPLRSRIWCGEPRREPGEDAGTESREPDSWPRLRGAEAARSGESGAGRGDGGTGGGTAARERTRCRCSSPRRGLPWAPGAGERLPSSVLPGPGAAGLGLSGSGCASPPAPALPPGPLRGQGAAGGGTGGGEQRRLERLGLGCDERAAV